MKYQVEISTYVTKTIEVEAKSKEDAEYVALSETDGNYDGIDFNQLKAGEFEVDEVKEII